MPYMSMDLQSKQSHNIKQFQRLIMSPQMQQAIHLLQMPIQDLSTVIEAELEQNPVLENEDDNPQIDPDGESLETDIAEPSQNEEFRAEQELQFDEHDFEVIKRLDDEFRDYISDNSHTPSNNRDEEKLQLFLESSIRMSESLFEHLMHQARESFSTDEQLAMAESIIGNLDRSGFLHMPLAEIAALYHYEIADLRETLAAIQQFDPTGVGATSLQESLLLQLTALGKSHSLAYQIISQHYMDLLHNRIPAIQKSFKVSAEEINQAVTCDISRLDLHPGASYTRFDAISLVPDVTIIQEDEHLRVAVNNDSLPPLRINQSYMRMLYDETLNAETRDFIKNKMMSAKWLLRNLYQRNETIERIAESLAKRQANFFMEPSGSLVPLTMKTIAEELSLHESTIARAVSNKYLDSPRGIFPLRFFFTNAYTSEEGSDISSKTVRSLLKELIDGEDKAKPLSDEALSTAIKARGIPCARRTIAKYRRELNLGNTQQRRKFR